MTESPPFIPTNTSPTASAGSARATPGAASNRAPAPGRGQEGSRPAHEWVMPLGKHQGQPISRIPIGYLTWMCSANHTHAARAKAELERRGTYFPKVEISSHAINRASQRLLNLWMSESPEPDREPGLHTWLSKRAEAALDTLESVPGDGTFRVKHDGIQFQFQGSHHLPALLTVMRRKNAK